MRRWFLVVPLAATFAVVGCGGGPTAQERCRTELEPFMAALGDLHSRLSVGLTYSEYTTRVGDVAVAHDGIRSEGLEPECREVLAIAERALELHRLAQELWDTCIRSTTTSCDDPKIAKGLQDAWRGARTALDRASSMIPS